MKVLTSLEPEQVSELLRKDEFFWLDLTAPEPSDFDRLGELLGLHPIALEEFREFGKSRAHLHPFGEYLVMTYFAADPEARNEVDPELPMFEVHLAISGSYVVTVHPAVCSELDELRRRFEAGLEGSEEAIVYRILDTLTDTLFPLLTDIGQHIDELEEQVMEDASEEQLVEIRAIKRQLVRLRGVVTSQRDLFSILTDEIERLPGLEQDDRDYYRGVYDHLVRLSEQVEDYRDLLTNVRDIYVSTVSNRLNEIMKSLTIIATIFLPLSFLVGFFGQNFGWLTSNIGGFAVFAALGLGTLLTSILLLVFWFRRRGMV
jgi:magnesium transporter